MLRDKMRWLFFTELLPDELAQASDEGKAVSGEEVREILELKDVRERESRAKEWMLAAERMPLALEKRLAEPETYGDIQRTLDGSAGREYLVSAEKLPERLRAAWAGRMSGCLLGIPVEGWTSGKIADFVRETAQDPRENYLSSKIGDELRKKYGVEDRDLNTPYDRQVYCWIDNVDAFPVDDDTNYTVAALRVVERCGRSFTADNVAENLLYGVPALHACTAERMAYRNLLNCVGLPDCAWYLNPYREWIGAQIRADFFGYINPGRPREAARMAYEDASVTHVRNGVYAEMYVAALVSLAPCGLEGIEMVEAAKRQIPPGSALAKALDGLMGEIRAGASYDEVIRRLHARYDESQWFWWGHAIPNALIVSAVVAYFGGDHSRAIGEAVLAGFDTDCNAATVGSIAGFKAGHVDARWLSRFAPVLRTSVHGYERLTLEELTERTLRLAQLPEGEGNNA